MSHTHKRATVVGGLAACLALIGAASAAASLSGSDGPSVPTVSEPTEGIETVAPHVGKLPAADSPSDAIAQTMAGLDADDFSNFSLGDPPAGQPDLPGSWAYITLKVPSTEDGAFQPALWEAYLAQGSVADRLAKQGEDLGNVISGSTILAQTSDSSGEDVGGGMGDAPAGQIFSAQADGQSDASITDAVTKTLQQFDLKPTTVKVLHPLGPAVYVEATTDSIDSMAGKLNSLTSALNPNGTYEGLYLQLDNTNGEPLVRTGSASRAAASSVWFAPGLDSLLGIEHGHAPTGDSSAE